MGKQEIISAIVRGSGFLKLFKCVVNRFDMNVDSCVKRVNTLYDTLPGSQHGISDTIYSSSVGRMRKI